MARDLRHDVELLRHRYGLLGRHGAKARHGEKSMIFSADDEARPSDRLIDVALQAVSEARHVSLTHLDERLPAPPYWPSVWPGEHYRLLAALARVLAPKTVIEIGTATGLSALAVLAGLPAGGRVVTFDLVPWREYPGTVLNDEDFADGRLTQHLDDLSTTEGMAKHRELIADAGLLFVDAAKDGKQEQRFLDLFDTIEFRNAPIVVFDDIRQWRMLRTWREVRRPKLDLTSFGHWSGTGLVDYAEASGRSVSEPGPSATKFA
jgi:predicted O-methyltransferase YrrM